MLLEGTPETSFPPALLRRADGRTLVPLAADIPGEGERLALLKLVAVMAGVSMAVLVQRDAQRRLQQLDHRMRADITRTACHQNRSAHECTPRPCRLNVTMVAYR
jgi:hypothetical protein